jgi:hypothetical protein
MEVRSVCGRTYASSTKCRGNTLREAAPRLHELPLRKIKAFTSFLRKSCVVHLQEGAVKQLRAGS